MNWGNCSKCDGAEWAQGCLSRGTGTLALVHEDFPREAITLGNQLLNLQSSFLKLICLRSCHKDSCFPPIVLCLLCKKNIPFTHHGPNQVHCPGCQNLHGFCLRRGPLKEGQESFRKKYWRQEKNSWWASFFPSSFPSLPFFLPPLFFFFFLTLYVL